ncbi:hypothetical protein T11_13519 [Trichinella zimbabwensis]|uniref:Secreted protein n=1 Tax=Trichinella zimbabwensis TaxID=268475 RepID=A0A0V1H9W8_9BILA|nr:hypothetical protein T11_13519 [Trichinella zimbabwensis]
MKHKLVFHLLSKLSLPLLSVNNNCALSEGSLPGSDNETYGCNSAFLIVQHSEKTKNCFDCEYKKHSIAIFAICSSEIELI